MQSCIVFKISISPPCLWLLSPFGNIGSSLVCFLFCLFLFLACLFHCYYYFKFYFIATYVCKPSFCFDISTPLLHLCSTPFVLVFCVFFLSVFCHCHSDCHALPGFAEAGQAVWKVGVAMCGSVNAFACGSLPPTHSWRRNDKITMMEIKWVRDWRQWDRLPAPSASNQNLFLLLETILLKWLCEVGMDIKEKFNMV